MPAGRPRKQLDAAQAEKYATVGCSHEEIAWLCGTTRELIERNFILALKAGTAKRNHNLRKMQYEAAKRGNIAMMIWLGKTVAEPARPPPGP
jgi:hypothetical protein